MAVSTTSAGALTRGPVGAETAAVASLMMRLRWKSCGCVTVATLKKYVVSGCNPRTVIELISFELVVATVTGAPPAVSDAKT